MSQLYFSRFAALGPALLSCYSFFKSFKKIFINSHFVLLCLYFLLVKDSDFEFPFSTKKKKKVSVKIAGVERTIHFYFILLAVSAFQEVIAIWVPNHFYYLKFRSFKITSIQHELFFLGEVLVGSCTDILGRH